MSTITETITRESVSRSSSFSDPMMDSARDVLRSINYINDYLSLTYAFRSTQTYFAPSVNHNVPIQTQQLMEFSHDGVFAINEIVNNIRSDLDSSDNDAVTLTFHPWSLSETRSITNYADSIANNRLINEDANRDLRNEILSRYRNSSAAQAQVMIYNPADSIREDAIYYDYSVVNNMFGCRQSTANVKFILERRRAYVSKCMFDWYKFTNIESLGQVAARIQEADCNSKFSIRDFHNEMINLFAQISDCNGDLVDKYGGLECACDLFKSHLYLCHYARSLEENSAFLELKHRLHIGEINDELFNITNINHILLSQGFSKFFSVSKMTPSFTTKPIDMFDGNRTFIDMYIKRNMLQWLFMYSTSDNINMIRSILHNVNRLSVNSTIQVGASTGQVSDLNMMLWTVGSSENRFHNSIAEVKVKIAVGKELDDIVVPSGFPIVLVGDAITSFAGNQTQHAPGARMPQVINIEQHTLSKFDLSRHARQRANENRGNRSVAPIVDNLNDMLTSSDSPLSFQMSPISNVKDDIFDDIVISKFDGSWVMDSSVTEGRCRLSSMAGVSGISGLHTVRLEWSLEKEEVGLFSDKSNFDTISENMNFYTEYAESVTVNNDSFRIIVAFNDAMITKVDGKLKITLNENDARDKKARAPIIVTVNGTWTLESDVGNLNINDIVHTIRRPGEFNTRNARGFLESVYAGKTSENVGNNDEVNEALAHELASLDTSPVNPDSSFTLHGAKVSPKISTLKASVIPNDRTSLQVGLSPVSVFDADWIDDRTFISDSLSAFHVWMASHSRMISYANRDTNDRNMQEIKMTTTITNRSTGFVSTVMKDHLSSLEDKFEEDSQIGRLISGSKSFFINSHSDGIDTARIALASSDDLDAMVRSGNTNHGIEPIFGSRILGLLSQIKNSKIDNSIKELLTDKIKGIKSLYAQIPKSVSVTNEIYSGLGLWYITELYNKMIANDKHKSMIDALILFTKKCVYENVVRERIDISFDDYVKLMDSNVGVALDTSGGVNETIINPNSDVLWFRAAITQCVKIIYSKSGNLHAVNSSRNFGQSVAKEAVINFSKRTLMSMFNPTFTSESQYGTHGLYFAYAVERDFWGATRASHTRRAGTVNKLSGDFTSLMNSINTDRNYHKLKISWRDEGKSTRITTGVDNLTKFIANITGGGFSVNSQKLLDVTSSESDLSPFDSVSVIDERGHFSDGMDHLIQKMISLQYAHELSKPIYRGNVGMVNLRSCILYTAIGWPSESFSRIPCKFIAYVQSNTRPSSRISRISTGVGSYIARSHV